MNDKRLKAASRTNRREAILDEAARMFSIKGFEGTSINDIADAVGVTKPALYYHVKDKDGLFAEITLSILKEICLQVEAKLKNASGGPSDRLKGLMAAHASCFAEHRHAYISAQLGFTRIKNPALRKQAVYWRDRYEHNLRTIIEDGIRAGEFAAVDPAIAGRLILSAQNWMTRWFNPDGPLTAVQVANQYYDIIIGGLRADQERDNWPPKRKKR